MLHYLNCHSLKLFHLGIRACKLHGGRLRRCRQLLISAVATPFHSCSNSEQACDVLSKVHPNLMAVCLPMAEMLLQEQGANALAAAIAHLSGFTQSLASRSVITYEQGWRTLQFTRNNGSWGGGFTSPGVVMGALAAIYPRAADEVGKIQMLDPMQGMGASLALNFSLLIWWAMKIYYHGETAATSIAISSSKAGWTRSASFEAELANTFNCSGHGLVYAEMFFQGMNDEVACDCDECFTGSHCEHVVPDCIASVDSGDPMIFLPYWKQNLETSAVLIPGWFRLGYEFFQPLIPGLEKEIRALHKMVGNAVTEGRYIVVGTGEMQLMMSAYTTASMVAQGLPVNVVITPPYYDAYERQVKTMKPGTVTWGKPSLDAESNADWVPLEVVISPNNPDGSLRTSVLKHPKTLTFYDHAYYWPHYTPITGPLDNDIMLFTLSKITGHAGSRIGWAIIKDFAVYEKMLLSVRLNSVGVSHDAQLRAAQLLRSAREGYAKMGNLGLNKSPMEYAAHQLLFHYGHTKLQHRWERMSQLFEGSDRFLIEQDFEPKYCNFLKETVRPGPAFVWIRCVREEDESCVQVFEEAGIVGRGGARCGMTTDRYVRLAMMNSDYGFENLLRRVQALVSRQP